MSTDTTPFLFSADGDTLACAWFWDDRDDPDREHVCIRRPDHPKHHACWCGQKQHQERER